jgi:hypothetical protein
MPYSTLVDQKYNLTQYFDVQALPHSVIIDRNGVVRATIEGGYPEEYLRDQLKKAGA